MSIFMPQRSLFFATQALTVLYWSRFLDHIGGKPVILAGWFGLSASVYCFGLSRTFLGLVMGCVALLLCTLLDSSRQYQAVLSMRTKWKHRCHQEYDRRDYGHHESPTYASIAWSSSSILGSVLLFGFAYLCVHHRSSPFIGGSLSNPVQQFPDAFGDWNFFKPYPYFLACAIPTTLPLSPGL